MSVTFISKKKFQSISSFIHGHSQALVIILFAFGIFFRSLYFLNTKVGFDQVQILNSAHSIIDFDITLIGPRTGPADMFTGPLIYYISAPAVFLMGDYLSVAFVPLFIAVFTGIMIYFISKRYFDKKTALFMILLWAFSPFIVNLDRVFWNPNFVLLSSFLLFSQLYTKNIDKFTPYLLFLGAFLAYQAHFSSLILIGIAITSLFIFKKPLKLALPILAGLFISLVPTLLFDLKNNFLNLNGLLGLASGNTEFSVLHILQSFISNIFILFETFGKLILFGNTTGTIIALGITLFAAALFVIQKKQFLFGLFWIVSIAVGYAFYSGETPEYYFLIIIPIFMFWIAELLTKTKSTTLSVLLCFFTLSSFFINTTYYSQSSGSTLGSIFKTEKYLKTMTIKEIAYDVPIGTEYGLKYFLSNMPLQENGDSIHIAHKEDLQNNQRAFAIEGLRIWIEKSTAIQPTTEPQ